MSLQDGISETEMANIGALVTTIESWRVQSLLVFCLQVASTNGALGGVGPVLERVCLLFVCSLFASGVRFLK